MKKSEQEHADNNPNTKNSSYNKRRITHTADYNHYVLVGIISFIIVALLISPFFHELFHVLVLKHYNCQHYWIDVHYPISKGISATINQQCDFTNNQLAVLYMAGVIGTLAMGFVLFVIDWILTKKDYLEYSIFTGFVAMGFLISPIVYFFQKEGDLVNTLNVLNIEYSSYSLPLIGICIMLLPMTYFWFNMNYTSEVDLIDEEIEELDKFGINKTKKHEHKKYMPKYKKE